MIFSEQLNQVNLADTVLSDLFQQEIFQRGVIGLGASLAQFPGKLVFKILDDQEELFLMRIYLPSGLLFHVFFQPDEEGWHTHPWTTARSYILFGGYWEERLVISDWKLGKRTPERILHLPNTSYDLPFCPTGVSGDYEIAHRVSQFLPGCEVSVSLFRQGSDKNGWSIFPVTGETPICMDTDASRDVRFSSWYDIKPLLPGGLFF